MPDSSRISSSHLDHLINDHGAEADSLQALAQMTLWRLDARTGSRLPAEADTLLYNYQAYHTPRRSVGSHGFSGTHRVSGDLQDFFDREETETFIFNNAYAYYLKDPEKLLFLNTRIPYSRLNYQRAGSRQTMEERFDGRLTSNFGKSLNVGLDVDLINAAASIAPRQ